VRDRHPVDRARRARSPHPSGDGYPVRVRRAPSWAITRAELTGYLDEAGWASVSWREPEDTGFFQPIAVAM
jgi:hypothetical protein